MISAASSTVAAPYVSTGTVAVLLGRQHAVADAELEGPASGSGCLRGQGSGSRRRGRSDGPVSVSQISDRNRRLGQLDAVGRDLDTVRLGRVAVFEQRIGLAA